MNVCSLLGGGPGWQGLGLPPEGSLKKAILSDKSLRIFRENPGCLDGTFPVKGSFPGGSRTNLTEEFHEHIFFCLSKYAMMVGQM
ncbi:hypothetical protein BOX24_01440 [Leptospirillum ferriphilum]|uniref:Uncharacterized protein n=1 Tax=Leptospirillum ferriphilum TaxID=178606 RepID=A0A1V3SY16_9BACT|nr:hypothetical protein BOX24_01440 [Leptospirillum ferriphilum]